ncbi:uncharacterized protein LOC132405480 [Hypanus sabinus]|uniref:uncharacterized protein LOC132405480 n=1 Tax=Hypanus sabinus TaxID=79690 RepID=UPI0028C4CD84|nr:uncharacterized protein LOC132405480 [Hypanus sabinus]
MLLVFSRISGSLAPIIFLLWMSSSYIPPSPIRKATKLCISFWAPDLTSFPPPPLSSIQWSWALLSVISPLAPPTSFKQKGVAMGTCMGLSYVCLFVGYVEQSMFQAYTGDCPTLFLRYTGIYIGAASCTRAELINFIHFASIFHPALKFTWSISDTSLIVSISRDSLSVNVYYKPMDFHSYLDYTSSHTATRKQKNGIPFSQFLCLHHICSQDEAFHSRMKEMPFFKERGFPPSTINAALNSLSSISCTSALTPSSCHPARDRVHLVLTYHPTSLHVQHLILRNFRHLQLDPTVKHIFPSPSPLTAFFESDSLVHSSLPTVLSPGAYPCKQNKCYTCPNTTSLTTIQGSK